MSDLRPPAKLPSIFGAREEGTMRRIGQPSATLQFESPTPPVTDNEYSEAAMERHFQRIADFIESVQHKLYPEDAIRWSSGKNALLDASGNGRIELDFPDGYFFDLRRLILWSDATTPAAPSTTGWVGCYHNNNNPGSLFDFAPPSAGAPVLPQISEYHYKTDPIFKSNEKLVVTFNGCTVSTNVSCLVWGNLFTTLDD